MIAGGKLFRSANLSQLSGEDISRFNALNISAIIDMRYSPERQKQPNKLPDGFSATTLAYEAGEAQATVKVAPHEAFMENDLYSGDDARAYMIGSYARRPFDVGFIKLAQKTLHHMDSTGDNILIHCAAGKDRTGLLVALIQHILGCSHDDIMYDYMLTMDAVNIDLVIDAVRSNISDKYGREFNAEMLRPMFGVSEDYLMSAFTAIGDIDEYLKNVLGLSPNLQESLNLHYK